MFVSHPLSVEEVNNLQSEGFVRIFGNAVEHSPAAAIGILKFRPFKDVHSIILAIYDFLDTLKVNEKEKILQLYPDIIENLTCHNTFILEKEMNEKLNGVGPLSIDEKRKLIELNDRYKEKFEFPFITGSTKSDVRTLFSEVMSRLQNSREDEIQVAMREVKNLVYLKVHEIVR